MATGYTSDIAKDQTFEDFVMSCARAFLIEMRDATPRAEIPDTIEPDTEWHEGELEKHRTQLKGYQTVSLDTAAMMCKDVYLASAKDAKHRRNDTAALRCKYEAMLLEVESWTPPTPEHCGLRDLMIEQIESSIKFDCSATNWLPEELPEPAEWLAEKIEYETHEIAYHEQKITEEIDRAKQRNAWVAALKRSLE